MPNKNRRRRNKRSNASKSVSPNLLLSGMDQVVTVHGKTFMFITATSGVAQFLLNPSSAGTGISSLGGRLSTLATCFEEFRFIKLVFKLSPTAASSALGYTIGYSKTIPNTAPTTAEGIYQADSSRYISSGTTVPQTLVIPTHVLRGGLRTWYKCQYNSTEDDLEDCNQGIFYSSNAGTTGGFTIECGYTIQLRGNDDPTST
jgi:hypothetical protein